MADVSAPSQRLRATGGWGTEGKESWGLRGSGRGVGDRVLRRPSSSLSGAGGGTAAYWQNQQEARSQAARERGWTVLNSAGVQVRLAWCLGLDICKPQPA